MKIDNFKIFLSVAHTENIHKTAEIFYTSVQNVSYIIKNMENELGFTLFLRDNKGMHLTEDGKDLLTIVEPFVYEYNDLLFRKQHKNEFPIFYLYTTIVMERYIRSLKEMLYSDYYYLSIKTTTVNEMLSMLDNNQQGIYLIPGYNGSSNNIVERKKGIVLAKDKTVLICHASNVHAQNVEELKKTPIISSGNYVPYVLTQKILNVDDVELCKKYMREKNFCYNTTHFVYLHDFQDDEWIIVDEDKNRQIEYDLIFNLPSYQLDMARQFFLEPLQKLFSGIDNE